MSTWTILIFVLLSIIGIFYIIVGVLWVAGNLIELLIDTVVWIVEKLTGK